MAAMSEIIDQDWRFERKTVLENADIQEVRTVLRSHNYLFRPIFHQRRIQSIYFDSGTFRHFNENVSGDSERAKLRIRWYGNQSSLISHGVLEVKIKKGGVGRKIRVPLDEFSLDAAEGKSLNAVVLASSAPDSVKEYFQYLRPTVLVDYWREYYLSADRRFRLTADWDIFYAEMQSRTQWGCPRRHDAVVLEVKYATEDETAADGVFGGLDLRLMKNSKYVNAIYTSL